MTQTTEPSALPFSYQAQTPEGLAISGTIDAPDSEQANRLLQQLRLRVLELEPAQRPPRPKTLRGDDFFAFNQQLAHLTRAGLPIEHGLKLIAQDMRNRRLGETVRQVADDMEHGIPIEQAFAKHARRFPPLYGRLIAAGVASSNLSAMLLNLGRHVELLYRLRAALWRAFAYPLMVLGGLALVLIFLGLVVLPQFQTLFGQFRIKLPWATTFLLGIPHVMPVLIAIGLVIVIGIPLLWMFLRTTGKDRAATDYLLLPLPLIGPVLRRNLIARWCDAVRLGILSGMDLPGALALASDAVGSVRLRRDGQLMIAMLESGQPIDQSAGRTSLIPATVPAAMGLARQDLPDVLQAMSEMYQQQAEMRLALIPVLLTPVLILLVAIVIGFVIAALFLPFINLITSLTAF
jgi:type IV pilus assembly protein PilC